MIHYAWLLPWGNPIYGSGELIPVAHRLNTDPHEYHGRIVWYEGLRLMFNGVTIVMRYL